MNIDREIQRLSLSWEQLQRDFHATQGELAQTYLKLLLQERSDFLRHFDHYQRFGEFSHPDIEDIKGLLQHCHERLQDYQSKLHTIQEDLARESSQQHKRNEAEFSADWAYALLGVAPSDSDDEIKRAYLSKVKRNHPDKLSGKELDDEFTQLAQTRTQEINRAWLIVRNLRQIK